MSNILIITIVILVAVLLIRMIIHGRRITIYFIIAANIYIWLNKKDAYFAALTSAKVASPKQRMLMTTELEKQEQSLLSIINTAPELRDSLERIQSMKINILEKEWSVSDIIVAKNELKKINPDYLKALEKADISIFKRCYPKLSAAVTLEDLINAALKESRNEVTEYINVIDQITKNYPELGWKNNQDIVEAKKELEDSLKKSKKATH